MSHLSRQYTMTSKYTQQHPEIGMYLHIPFCHRPCHYCNFFFSVNHSRKSAFLTALLQEIKLKRDEIPHRSIRSIYFGGGTPSVLSTKEVNTILSEIRANYSINSDAEITFEMNPEDCNQEYLAELQHAGITRISLGVQSFHSEALKIMNRGHSESEAKQAIELTERYFDNYSVDIIYGIQKADNFLSYSLDVLKQYQPKHVSAYQLTIEPQTVIGNLAKKGQFHPKPDEEIEADLEYLINTLSAQGIQQYEVSNFATPGYEAVHNSSYWEQYPYLGLGPSSSSYDGNLKRMKNIPSNKGYIEQWKQETEVTYWETEDLTRADYLNELMMLRFRTRSGIQWNKLQSILSPDDYSFLHNRIQSYHNQEVFVHEKRNTRIQDAYFWISDQVLEELWIEEDELPN